MPNMSIVITASIVAFEHLNRDERGNAIGFSTMHPVESPMFATYSEVTNWYKTQHIHIKVKFKLNGYLAIYQHVIATSEQVSESGYVPKIGEILCTDEYSIYDFDEKKWI